MLYMYIIYCYKYTGHICRLHIPATYNDLLVAYVGFIHWLHRQLDQHNNCYNLFKIGGSQQIHVHNCRPHIFAVFKRERLDGNSVIYYTSHRHTTWRQQQQVNIYPVVYHSGAASGGVCSGAGGLRARGRPLPVCARGVRGRETNIQRA